MCHQKLEITRNKEENNSYGHYTQKANRSSWGEVELLRFWFQYPLLADDQIKKSNLRNASKENHTSSTSCIRVTSDFSVLLFKNKFSFLSSLIDFAIYILHIWQWEQYSSTQCIMQVKIWQGPSGQGHLN